MRNHVAMAAQDNCMDFHRMPLRAVAVVVLSSCAWGTAGWMGDGARLAGIVLLGRIAPLDVAVPAGVPVAVPLDGLGSPRHLVRAVTDGKLHYSMLMSVGLERMEHTGARVTLC